MANQAPPAAVLTRVASYAESQEPCSYPQCGRYGDKAVPPVRFMVQIHPNLKERGSCNGHLAAVVKNALNDSNIRKNTGLRYLVPVAGDPEALVAAVNRLASAVVEGETSEREREHCRGLLLGFINGRL